MRDRGVEQVPVELDENEPLPDWREFDAVLAMGGPMGAVDDEHPWLAPERLVREAVDGGRPFLGVCLGVQLLAAALDAPVYPAERPEVGLLPVELTPEGRDDPLFAGVEEPLVSLQWHGDTFDLPDGSALLARSPRPEPGFPGGGTGVRRPVPPRGHRRDGSGVGEVPAYQRSLADTLGEEDGARFIADVERRADELHPRRAARCSRTGSTSRADLCVTLVEGRFGEHERRSRPGASGSSSTSSAARPGARAGEGEPVAAMKSIAHLAAAHVPTSMRRSLRPARRFSNAPPTPRAGSRQDIGMADQLDVAHRLDAHHADQRAVGLIAPEHTPAAISPSSSRRVM